MYAKFSFMRRAAQYADEMMKIRRPGDSFTDLLYEAGVTEEGPEHGWHDLGRTRAKRGNGGIRVIADDIAKRYPPEETACGCGRGMARIARVKDGCTEDTVIPCRQCCRETADAWWLFLSGKISEAGFYRRMRKAGKPG